MNKLSFMTIITFTGLLVGLGWLASAGNLAAVVALTIVTTVALVSLGAVIALAAVGRGNRVQDFDTALKAQRLLAQQNQQLISQIERQDAQQPMVLGGLVGPYDDLPPLLGFDERNEQ